MSNRAPFGFGYRPVQARSRCTKSRRNRYQEDLNSFPGELLKETTGASLLCVRCAVQQNLRSIQ